MIERKRLLSMGYYAKAPSFTGSDGNKNYKIEKYMLEINDEETGEAKEEKKLKATMWPGPLCFSKTDDEKKQSQIEDFSEEGLLRLVDWMNQTEV